MTQLTITQLQVFLEQFHELHIRLVSNRRYDTISPALSRLPAGLHVFFTPRTTSASTELCSRLTSLLGDGVKCDFSKPPILSERFASAATYQFYHEASNLSDVSEGLGLCTGNAVRKSNLCDILSTAKSAAYVDYDFDVISHALNVAILWDSPSGLPAEKLDAGDRLEVGILQTEKATEPEEISLGGYLTVVGDDDEPSATLFSFPARHHQLPPADDTTFTTAFQSPTGLHPKMDIVLPQRDLTPPKDGCALHAYFTLPSWVFIDRYQFSDPLFLESQNLVALRSLSGEEDLEAPDWAVKPWGSAALFELAHPAETTTGIGNWTVTVPMHLRYIGAAGKTGNNNSHTLPWPVVFWACEAEESSKMSTNPFDRTNLGYDGLFGKAMFYHIPAAAETVARLEVPVMEDATWAPVGTAVAVLLGFGWVLWKLMLGSKLSTLEGKKKEK